MRSSDVAAWIGIAGFVGGFVVGRWWFVAGVALVVAVIVGATASVEVSPAVVGIFFGAGVGLAMLVGFLFRLWVNWVVEMARESRGRRR